MNLTLRRLARYRTLFTRVMMEVVLVIICIYLSFRAPNFLSVDNFFNILRSVSMQGIIAYGMTMVIIAGEIDLSVGSMVAFSGCLLAYLCSVNVPIYAGITLTLGVCFATGAFTGLMRTRYGVPSFITTLALFTALHGAALMITKGFPISSFPPWFNFLGGGYVWGVPFPALVLLVAFLFAHFVMNYTTFGRAVYAVGGNAEAARLCGIPVARVRILVLAITSTLAGISGFLMAARIMSGTPTVGQGLELDVIAAVIIGGTSLAGGIGSIWGTLMGIVFIGVIINGMTLMNVDPYEQYVIRGGLILAAVLVNRLQIRASERQ